MFEFIKKVNKNGTLKKRFRVLNKTVAVFNNNTNSYILFDENGNVETDLHKELDSYVSKICS